MKHIVLTVWAFLMITGAPAIMHSQSILVDHTSVAQFDSIPSVYAQAAANMRMLFMDRSVGGNISEYLDCLAASYENAPSRCKRYQHRDSSYAVDPSVVHWNGTWDRRKWRYEYWPGCSEDAICFIDFIEPRIDSFDVVGFQFSYLAVTPGSKINDPATGFFTPGTDKNTAEAYAAFAARYPSKTVIWWTTSLARGIGSPESETFNDAMRDYARQRNIVLFDVADILSHNPDGNPCYDNRDGVQYLEENNPDDGLEIPAICPQYTTETEGGHLGSIAAGGIRVAKAFWVLMARIAGWQGGTGPVDTLHVPEKVQLISPPDLADIPSDTVIFKWHSSRPDVSKYRIQLAITQTFSNIAVDDSSIVDTTIQLSGLAQSQRYFWRVQARNSDGWGPWSDARTLLLSTSEIFSATPLTEMGRSLYKGYPGGLYPSTMNERPQGHNDAGLALANAIVPLDTLGQLDSLNGKIVMMSIGMSNTSQEYSFFENVLDTFALKNPYLVSVNGAQGGQTAVIIKNPDAQFWTVIEEQRLPQCRVTKEQVQVVWLKEANASPSQEFPRHAEMLRDDIREVVKLLPQKYPNVKLCYLSSRTYGGYATSPLNPEPYAYESGFAVRWLIEDQINGDDDLSYTTTPPNAPWLSWGAYLWANGLTPRQDNGLYWVRDDFVQDGTHPSTSGREKVATLLIDFFTTDDTSVPWFLKKEVTGVEEPVVPQDLELSIAPNPAVDHAVIRYNLEKTETVRIEISSILGASARTVFSGVQTSGSHILSLSASNLRISPGIYVVRLSTANGSVFRKVAFLR